MSAVDHAPQGLFVTGTDTGVGKTVASAALLHALRADGQRVVGMKPVASGCEWTAEGWRNDDALALQAASDGRPEYALVNPFALPEATAPQLAARRAGIPVSLEAIVAAYGRLSQGDAGGGFDTVVVEGVGGWLAPLADDLDQSGLARALAITDVVLVVGMRLGCINHARLSARAIAADGFRLAGWIANTASPDEGCDDDYFNAVQAALPAPCLGRLPYTPGLDAGERAARLRLGPLCTRSRRN